MIPDNATCAECIEGTLKAINRYLADLRLKARLVKDYPWNDNVVGIYIHGSSRNGTLRIGCNTQMIIDDATSYDEDYFDPQKIAAEDIAMTLWHEAGHGLMEHIRRTRRKDTQKGTGLFKGPRLKKLKALLQDEEDTVEKFADSMAGFSYTSDLETFINDNKEILINL